MRAIISLGDNMTNLVVFPTPANYRSTEEREILDIETLYHTRQITYDEVVDDLLRLGFPLANINHLISTF